MATSGNRAIDMLITYRILKILVTPFEKQDAFKYGIIDAKGKILKKYSKVSRPEEKKAYTWLHRFLFNIKRLLGRVGLGSRLGSLATALALLLKEHNVQKLEDGSYDFNGKVERVGLEKRQREIPDYAPHVKTIESAIITHCKNLGIWENMLAEDRNLPPIVEHITEKFEEGSDEVIGTYFGIDVYKNATDHVSNPREWSIIADSIRSGVKSRDRGMLSDGKTRKNKHWNITQQ